MLDKQACLDILTQSVVNLGLRFYATREIAGTAYTATAAARKNGLRLFRFS